MDTPDFSPMSAEAKSKTLDHYRQMLLEAQELARLDAMPRSQRARELRNALEDIARAGHEQQTLTADPGYREFLDRQDEQSAKER